MAMGVACICSAVSAGDLTVDGRDGAAIQRAIDADCTNAGPLKRVDGWSWETYRQQKLGAVKIVVDATKPTGPVKPVNAAGQPPLLGRRDHSLFHYLAEAGIPYSRLHDTGGYQGANVFVDIPNVFRDFDADEDDPANYDFAFTDDLLAGLVKHGVEPFYRLGATVSTAGDSGKVWSLAAAKDGRVAVMVANFGDTDVPFGLDLGCVPSECILTDETRTAEKVAVPEVLPRHSFLLVQGRR